MRTKTIIQPLVGTTKIVVKDISYDVQSNALVIKARPLKNLQCRCGVYHLKAPLYDSGQGTRRW